MKLVGADLKGMKAPLKQIETGLPYKYGSTVDIPNLPGSIGEYNTSTQAPSVYSSLKYQNAPHTTTFSEDIRTHSHYNSKAAMERPDTH